MKQVEVYCPWCKNEGRGAVKLVIRTNRQSGNQFLGCPNWRRCEYTQPIPESIRMEAIGASRLPGM